MTPSRFTDDQVETIFPQPSAFLMMSVAPAEQTQTSSLQWLYQQMYQEAAKANTPTPTRELFSVMN